LHCSNCSRSTAKLLVGLSQLTIKPALLLLTLLDLVPNLVQLELRARRILFERLQLRRQILGLTLFSASTPTAFSPRLPPVTKRPPTSRSLVFVTSVDPDATSDPLPAVKALNPGNHPRTRQSGQRQSERG
jgi:hypothetical protein